MKKIFEKIINEIPENKELLIIRSASKHIIDSSINLFKLIEKHFSEEEKEILFKKFVLSIKNKDSSKFHKKLKQLFKEKGDIK